MKKIISLSLMIVMVIATLISLTGCSGSANTINIDKYMTVNVSGYEGMGVAEAVFDEEAFRNDYTGKIQINGDLNQLFGETEVALMEGYGYMKNGKITDEYAIELFLMCVDGNLDKSSGLKNGDVITYKWSCDIARIEEYFGCSIQASDIETTVSGLEEADAFNPFAHVKVNFSGVAPNGTAAVTVTDPVPEMDYISFNVTPNSGLNIGDDVTVEAVIAAPDEFVSKFQEVLEKSDETYQVDSLDVYITDVSEIPEDLFAKMDQQIKDSVASTYANYTPMFFGVNTSEELEDMELIGTYLLTAKEGMSIMNYNQLYLVYKVSAIINGNTDIEYYTYGKFYDVIKLKDGTCSVDLSSIEGPFDTVSTPGGYFDHSIYGYDDIESLFNKTVTAQLDSYEYVTTVDE